VSSQESLSSEFVAAAEAEREILGARLIEANERAEHFGLLASKARDEAASLAASITGIDEMLGLAPQIALCEISEELRGERLREVALDVLRDRSAPNDPIHYRAWFDELVASGFRVSGKDPLASFLTQVSRIERVEKVGGRSGLYRLRLAA
jgi:hypothetical protein